MKIKKRYIFVIALIIFSFVLTACTQSKTGKIDVPEVKENTYVYDEDDIIDDVTEKKLNKMLIELEDKTTVEFVILTVKSLNGLSIEDYAVDIANTLGIGKKDKDNGLLLLMSREDERVRIEVGYGITNIMTAGRAGEILDEFFVPYRETDKYTEATEETTKAILNLLSERYHIEIEELEEAKPLEKEEWPFWLKMLIVCIIVIIIILMGIFSDDSGGGYSGRSGGFGGSGFGSSGFGGGGFGGSGASR